MTFPNSKIELHQWVNSLLLLVVGFFVTQTYLTIQSDHEKLAEHDTRLTVVEKDVDRNEKAVNYLTGRFETRMKYK